MLSRHRIVCALAVLGFACWCVLIQALLPLPERGSDFRAFYTAASVPWSKLYDLNYLAAFQDNLWKDYGHYSHQPFPRAPFYALLLRPLGLLSYPAALHVWLAILSVAFLLCAWLLARLYGGGLGTVPILAAFYPVSFSLTIGQDAALVLASLLLTIYFFRRNQEWTAAFFLSLAFQKFHLLLLIPVAFLLHSKKRFLAKWCCWLAAWVALNLALIGISGWRAYLHVLDAGIVDRLYYRAWNIRSVVAQLGWSHTAFAVGVAGVVIWYLWLGPRLSFETAFWAATAFSVVVAWHSLKYDYALALPLFYLLWTRHRVLVAAVFLFGGLWVHALLGEQRAWLIAPLVLGMSVEFWWRSRPASGICRFGCPTLKY